MMGTTTYICIILNININLPNNGSNDIYHRCVTKYGPERQETYLRKCAFYKDSNQTAG